MNSREQSDKWEEVPYDKHLIDNTVKLAERDLKTSKDVFNNNDYDWSFSIAYNAML